MRINKKSKVLLGIIIVTSILVLSLLLAVGHKQDPLVRIMKDINRQGYSTISTASQATVKATSAEMVDGKLVVYGSNVALVEVDLSQGAGFYDVCTAKKVSFKHAINPKSYLQITFVSMALKVNFSIFLFLTERCHTIQSVQLSRRATEDIFNH